MYWSHYPQFFNVVLVAYIAVDKSRPAEKGSLAKLGILQILHTRQPCTMECDGWALQLVALVCEIDLA